MKVIERRVLRGPNIYAKRPVYLAVIDLESLDGVASTEITGFIEALLTAVPTLNEHRCSPGYAGGFVERLRGGTYMAHIIEHLAIELQCLVGCKVGFGRARRVAGMPRHYRVVFAYRSEHVAAAALSVATELVSCLAAGEAPAMEAGMILLRRLAQAALAGPSTSAIVEAAERRGIPAIRLTEHASLFQLGWGLKQKRVQATMTSQTNHIAVGIASDKELTKILLKEAGLPVPFGWTVSTLEAAHAAAHSANGPVAMKPLCGNQGKGVTTAVSGTRAVAAAFVRAQQFGRKVLIEQHVEGDDYRLLVIGYEMIAASRRVPPEVIGDGQSDVRQLVALINADPRRGDGHENVLTKIRLDEAAAEELARQGLDVDSVPGAGQIVRLRGNANLSTGGMAQDVTSTVHPDTVCACVLAARKIGLDVAGIDLVCHDIAVPLAAQGGAIIEVNAAPGIRMHEHPSLGERRHAGRAIVETLFPLDDDGRVPIIAITGSNGKTTAALSIAHVLQRIGYVTGVATTEGITVAGRSVEVGDCTDYRSARAVLMSPEVGFAVLETGCGGMLASGLGFDKCDVGIVLNIREDQLGRDGIDTLQDLARVMGLVVAIARKAVVLNADDALCAQLASRAPRGTEVIYFGLDAAHPTMANHLEQGGRAVYSKNGMVMWADGGRQLKLIDTDQMSSTIDGDVRPNVANAMAVFAALLALAVPKDRIAAGLGKLGDSAVQLRGMRLRDDRAHDAASEEAFIATDPGRWRKVA